MKCWLMVFYLIFPVATAWAAVVDEPVSVAVDQESDHVVLTARFLAPVTRELAWDVLVDFERMPRFLPFLKESKVLFRRGNTLRLQQQGVLPVGFLDVGYTSVRDIELFPVSEIHSTSVGGDSGLTRSISRLLQGDRQTEISYRADWWPTSQMVAGFGMSTARDLLSRQFTAMRSEMLRRQSQ